MIIPCQERFATKDHEETTAAGKIYDAVAVEVERVLDGIQDVIDAAYERLRSPTIPNPGGQVTPTTAKPKANKIDETSEP